jgi:glycerophosphoryl diester phosphodiesterase
VPAGKRAFVEIKIGPAAIPALQRALQLHARPVDEVVIMSFKIETVREAKRRLPAHNVHWLVGKERHSNMIACGRDAGADALNILAEPDVDAALVKQVHDAGLQLFVWTIDDPPLAKRMLAIGVDGITTNRAAWMREQLSRKVNREADAGGYRSRTK